MQVLSETSNSPSRAIRVNQRRRQTHVSASLPLKQLPDEGVLSHFLSLSSSNKALLWAEEGYKLFAEEGVDGIQVERLARITRLNKSGFYNYFGQPEGYYDALISLHQTKVSEFLHDIQHIKTFDPEYLQLLTKHAVTVMFQVQLTRHKGKRSLYEASEVADQRINLAVQDLWSKYMSIRISSDISMRYYHIIRDMLYTRISFRQMNYAFLHNLISEAKTLFIDIRHSDVSFKRRRHHDDASRINSLSH